MTMTLAMTTTEFVRIVQQECDNFESTSGLTISPEARNAIIAPGLPHLEDVTRALSKGELQLSDLQTSVRTILENAAKLPPGTDLAPIIGISAIHASMKVHCPYLFWC